MRHGFLAGMPERRIAYVMGKARSLYNRSEIRRQNIGWKILSYVRPDSFSQSSSDLSHLEAVCEASVHVIVSRQGMHLSLSTEAAERTREHDTVDIRFEASAAARPRSSLGVYSQSRS
jgi:hypothetical protein